jgi:hypothetical protein
MKKKEEIGKLKKKGKISKKEKKKAVWIIIVIYSVLCVEKQ